MSSPRQPRQRSKIIVFDPVTPSSAPSSTKLPVPRANRAALYKVGNNKLSSPENDRPENKLEGVAWLLTEAAFRKHLASSRAKVDIQVEPTDRTSSRKNQRQFDPWSRSFLTRIARILKFEKCLKQPHRERVDFRFRPGRRSVAAASSNFSSVITSSAVGRHTLPPVRSPPRAEPRVGPRHACTDAPLTPRLPPAPSLRLPVVPVRRSRRRPSRMRSSTSASWVKCQRE